MLVLNFRQHVSKKIVEHAEEKNTVVRMTRISRALLRLVAVSIFLSYALPAFGDSVFIGQKNLGKENYKSKLALYMQEKNYKQFGKTAKQALKKGLSKRSFQKLVAQSDEATVKKALIAAKAMCKRCKNIGITLPDLFQISMFIETEMPKQLKKEPEKLYFSRVHTGLTRSIQYDPHSKLVFIHLKSHGVCALGKGARKKVTRSILYSTKNPKVVAHCHTAYRIDNEIQAAIDLRGKKGLQEVFAVMQRKCKDGSNLNSIMTRFYKGGDLHHYLNKNRRKMTLKEKMNLAYDISIGIANMHNNGYTHRDLGLKNYFVETIKNKGRKKIVAIVGDFGRAAKDGKTKERGAQGGFSQLAPEGIAYDKLQDSDYLKTDVYALGCVFYRIIYGGKVPWHNVGMMNNGTLPVEERIEKSKMNIVKFWDPRLKTLERKGKKSLFKYESLIRKMVDPDPALRPSAQEVKEQLRTIIKNARGS